MHGKHLFTQLLTRTGPAFFLVSSGIAFLSFFIIYFWRETEIESFCPDSIEQRETFDSVDVKAADVSASSRNFPKTSCFPFFSLGCFEAAASVSVTRVQPVAGCSTGAAALPIGCQVSWRARSEHLVGRAPAGRCGKRIVRTRAQIFSCADGKLIEQAERGILSRKETIFL